MQNIKFGKTNNKEVKEFKELIGACIVLHNLLINYDDDDILHEWYSQMSNNIDWSMYDEEILEKNNVHDEEVCRGDTIVESIVNNFFI
jgi:hypothetical protein